MNICNEIQQKIADLGMNEVIVNQDELEHIKTCQACQDYQQACEEMNHAMSGLGDYDADEAVVESTLNSILSLQEETKKPKSLLNTQWASALAASFMLVSLIALFPYNSISNYGLFSNSQRSAESVKIVSEAEKQKIKQRKAALSKKKQDNSGFEFIDVDVADEVNAKMRRIPKKPAPRSSRQTIDQLKSESSNVASAALILSPTQKMEVDMSMESIGKISHDNLKKDANKELERLVQVQSLNSPQEQNSMALDEPLKESKGIKLNAEGLGQALVYPSNAEKQDRDQRQDGRLVAGIIVNDLEKQTYEVLSESEEERVNLAVTGDSVDGYYARTKKSNKEKGQLMEQRRNQMRDETIGMDQESDEQLVRLDPVIATGSRVRRSNNDGVDNSKNFSDKFIVGGKTSSSGKLITPRLAPKTEKPAPLSPAKQFLAELNSLDNITYQTDSGYWANNYLPGDASMRLLAANLLRKDVDINSIVAQNRQPFDYPSNSALAVYLSSDHANVKAQKPTRMRLQVGIQASNRKGGHRSAMNIGLVFDVTDNSSESTAKMKALLLALLKAKQASDNVSVTLAGVNGGVLIKASEFRYGTIQATMNRLASIGINEQSVAISLHQAIKLASVNLQKDDDPSASLGSSVVMLITDKNIEDISAIETTIHNNAVKGITLSTVSLGDDNHQQLNQLALAGQGHARVLQNANDAKRVVEAELLASSRAVARALRLRIRLAKGVKLIKVLDSYNLNDKQAQRVRDAENSLDKRLSKNLGIQADRGEDEEGIQIVIPSFFAGDTHVVVLDVVANNPGAIADVSIRYKDLLYLRNAISRKQLNLGNDEKTFGPLQLNVLKNVLASRFANDIKQASVLLKSGNSDAALSHLFYLQKLYQSMRLEFPIWNNDTEISKDEKLIQQYIDLINQTSKNDAPQVNYIVDSLQYISWRKNITQSK